MGIFTVDSITSSIRDILKNTERGRESTIIQQIRQREMNILHDVAPRMRDSLNHGRDEDSFLNHMNEIFHNITYQIEEAEKCLETMDEKGCIEHYADAVGRILGIFLYLCDNANTLPRDDPTILRHFANLYAELIGRLYKLMNKMFSGDMKRKKHILHEMKAMMESEYKRRKDIPDVIAKFLISLYECIN